MAVGITTTDGKDLDERYVKMDSNGKAPNAVNADYATNAGTATNANNLNGTLPVGKLPTLGAATIYDRTYKSNGDVNTIKIFGEKSPGDCYDSAKPIYTYYAAIKRDTYGRVEDLGNYRHGANCNCQCQD